MAAHTFSSFKSLEDRGRKSSEFETRPSLQSEFQNNTEKPCLKPPPPKDNNNKNKQTEYLTNIFFYLKKKQI